MHVPAPAHVKVRNEVAIPNAPGLKSPSLTYQTDICAVSAGQWLRGGETLIVLAPYLKAVNGFTSPTHRGVVIAHAFARITLVKRTLAQVDRATPAMPFVRLHQQPRRSEPPTTHGLYSSRCARLFRHGEGRRHYPGCARVDEL